MGLIEKKNVENIREGRMESFKDLYGDELTELESSGKGQEERKDTDGKGQRGRNRELGRFVRW